MKNKIVLITALFFLLSGNLRSQCGQISLIGEFNGWADDHFLEQDTLNTDLYYTVISIEQGDDQSEPPDGIIEMKFRENQDWTINWGNSDFPEGTGILEGPNIPVPYNDTIPGYTTYFVSFNCISGEYSFEETCGEISLIGEFSGWANDYEMNRDEDNIDLWSVTLIVTSDDDDNDDGIIETKFRENNDWSANWGNEDFPEGMGIQDGLNIPVRYNDWQDSTFYLVTFNCMNGEYVFADLTCGFVSIIGEFTGWEGDLDMIQDSVTPQIKNTHISLTDLDDTNSDGLIELKFRNNHDWEVNWGGDNFPTSTGYQDGPNIFVPISSYDVSFNCETFEYNFVETSGINGIDLNQFIILAPNPAKEIITIRSTNGLLKGWINISICDISGREILKKKDFISQNNNIITFQIDQLDPGIYFIDITASDGKKAVKKLIVQ